MNREIKFRVYDKDLKRMRYLNSSHDFICFDEKGNSYYHNMQTGLGEWFSDLMQYTGLKDKNGVEVYEGDLLKSYYEKPGIIKWNDELGAFQVKGIPSQTMKRCHEMEVIGNIYENAVADYEKTMFEKEQLNSLVNSCQEEIRQLKKQLEDIKQELTDERDENYKLSELWCNSRIKVRGLETQQKEFIKYMNDIIEDLETEDADDEEMKGYLIQRIDIFKEILQKYKNIIGSDK